MFVWLLQGQLRHNWKVRKFVLYEEPAKLTYFSPTKVCIHKIYAMIGHSFFVRFYPIIYYLGYSLSFGHFVIILL